jgi:hypothetical protein
MLVRDEIEKPNAFPAFMVMLPADGPAVQVPLAEVTLPDVSRRQRKRRRQKSVQLRPRSLSRPSDWLRLRVFGH